MKNVFPVLPFGLRSMCDDVFVLNVLSRERRLKKIDYRAFYTLKNLLIKYLYEYGYCIEVLEHKRDHECWTCEGEGCFRCGGTGVHHTELLYGFTFYLAGKTYKWHQLQRFCDYAVKLTEITPMPYVSTSEKGFINPSEQKQIWMMARTGIGLWLRGVRKLPRLIGVYGGSWQLNARRRVNDDHVPF
jgi:hypothetical protein